MTPVFPHSVPISSVQAAGSYGYSLTSLFFLSSSFITPSALQICLPCTTCHVYIAGHMCVCVRESSFTHPLGPGLCPCVKRQSLLGGFCCEDNVGCNINGMFHCGNRESFLRRDFGLNRCCFVADTSVCGSVYLSVIHKHFFSVRLKKGSQMATDMCIAKGSILFQKLQMSTQTQ